MRLRARVVVTGRVQGVGFRFSTRRRAEALGLSGWVRNLPDGRVEALFEGEPEPVREAVAWIREGPSLARVGEVEVDEQPLEGPPPAHARFEIRA